MSVQKATDKLKNKSNDEKKIVAGSIAVSIVIALFFGWAILIFKRIGNGEDLRLLGGGAQNEFLGSAVRDAQKSIMSSFVDIDELRRVRDEAGQQYQDGYFQQNLQENDIDVFGASNSIE